MVHPADEVHDAAIDLATRYAGDPAALTLAERAIMDGLSLPLDEAVKIETERFADCFETEDAPGARPSAWAQRPTQSLSLHPLTSLRQPRKSQAWGMLRSRTHGATFCCARCVSAMIPLLLRRRLQAVTRAARTASAHAMPTEAEALGRLDDVLPKDPVVVDVGANTGRWTRELLARYPTAQVLMIEAQAELLPGLCHLAARHERASAVNATLASTRGKKTFYVCHGDRYRSGSSLLPELSGHPLEERTVMTQTLDVVVREADLGGPVDFIKLDTQGSELDILAGGAQALATASLVQMELSVLRYNEDAPLLAQAVAFMAEHGFSARDLFDLMYLPDTDTLVQVNCIFARESREIGDVMS